MITLKGGLDVASWDEEPYGQPGDGERKITRAEVVQTASGDFAGSSTAHWLMAYHADGSARVVGLQVLEGTIGDRTGSFVVECAGGFDGQEAQGAWTIIPGSGTDGFASVSGTGSFRAPMGAQATYDLECEFG